MAAGRTKGGRRGRAPGKTWQEKAVDKDVFEAEDSDPEEDRLKSKYDVSLMLCSFQQDEGARPAAACLERGGWGGSRAAGHQHGHANALRVP